MLQFTRVVRTPHSERHLLREDDRDLGALDLHFLPEHKVAGSLVLFDGAPTDETSVAALLTAIDERLLPDTAMSDGDITFTVTVGRVLATFRPNPEG